jgi:membrane protease YdiL (CAAX protease family)
MNIKKFILTLLKIILVLALIQGFRMLLTKLLFLVIPYNASGMALNSFVSFSILLLSLFIYFICCRDKINFFPTNKKKLYIIFTVLIFILILSTPSLLSDFNITNIVTLIHSILLIPIFEEILFRGIIWTKLEKISRNEKLIFFTTTILFGLWHIGYIDTIIINTSLRDMTIDIPNVLFGKVLIGLAFGLFTGYARFKTDNVYTGLLIHSFLNIFGK